MNSLTKRKRIKKAEEAIDRHIENLIMDAKTEEEIKTVIALMEKRQNLDKDKKKLDPNTIAIIAANLLGIGLILSYEKLHVVTTKALGFVIKGRV